MRWTGIVITCAAAICLVGCHSGETAESPYGNEETPKPKTHDVTAAENAKALADNPNLTPAQKKILGGAGH